MQNSSSNSQFQSSETAQALTSTTKAVLGATAVVVIISGVMNASSLSCLWMSINQLQLFLLLLLIRAFIPKDIQIIIEGFDFASYLYGFIPWNKIDIYPSFLYNFKFPLINSSLEVVGMQYGSTIANIFSILAWNFLMIVFTLIILLVKFLSKIF